MKRGLVLDRVVLLGRTLEEYRRYFALDLAAWRGRRILDVAAGVSSFCAEACAAGLQVTACDPIYALAAAEIEPRCVADLDLVVNGMHGLPTYRWDFYESPKRLRSFRERAYRTFLDDYRRAGASRYVSGRLPELPFGEAGFDLTLVSYLMFAYEEQLDYPFHQQAVREIMRVTRGEARLYPVVNFEAQRCGYIDRLKADPALTHLDFEEVETDFEFLRNSQFYLRVKHKV